MLKALFLLLALAMVSGEHSEAHATGGAEAQSGTGHNDANPISGLVKIGQTFTGNAAETGNNIMSSFSKVATDMGEAVPKLANDAKGEFLKGFQGGAKAFGEFLNFGGD